MNRLASQVMIVASIMGSILIASLADAEKIADKAKLATLAQTRGMVKVLVEFSMPSFEALASASATAGTDQADAALAKGIQTAAESMTAKLPAEAYRVHRIFRTVPYAALAVSSAGLDGLETLPDVLSVTEDVAYPLTEPMPETSVAPPTELAAPQLQNTVKVIGATNAWNMGYTGKGWYVAVLDTGILRTHQFFQGKQIAEACFTTRYASYGAVGICPNGQESMTGPGSAAHQRTASPGWDHGTHVAGIAAGKKGALAGVAKDAGILAVNVFSKFVDRENCGGYASCVLAFTSDQIAGLEYIYGLRNRYKIASVNMSLGGGFYSSQSVCDSQNAPTKRAIDNLKKVGITTAIASGNEAYCSGIGAPGCISSAIAVGATDDNDREASFSNWYPTLLDLFAPGVSVYSATGNSNGSFASWNGTSMATPHVAGAIALIKQAKPSATVAQIMSVLQQTGFQNVKTRCGSGKKPRIQVDAAIKKLIGSRASGVFQPAGWYTVNGAWTLNNSSAVVSSGLAADASIYYQTKKVTTGTYTATLKRTGSATAANYLYFRGQPAPSASSGAWFSGYYFAYANTGRFTIWLASKGQWQQLLDWTNSAAIQQYQQNELQIAASTNALTFAINNQVVATLAQPSLKTGYLGLGMAGAAGDLTAQAYSLARRRTLTADTTATSDAKPVVLHEKNAGTGICPPREDATRTTCAPLRPKDFTKPADDVALSPTGTSAAKPKPGEKTVTILKRGNGTGIVKSGKFVCDTACTRLEIPLTGKIGLNLQATAAANSYFVRWETLDGKALTKPYLQAKPGDTLIVIFKQKQ